MTIKKDLKDLNSRLDTKLNEIENQKKKLASIPERSLVLYNRHESIKERLERTNSLNALSIRIINTIFFDTLRSELALAIAEIRAIQVRQIHDLINSNYFKNYLAQVLASTRTLTEFSSTYQARCDRLRENMLELVKAQIEFRERFQGIVSESLQPYLALQDYIREWTRSVISINAEILGLKFDFKYTRESYKEHRQVVVELDQGINENGLEVYQAFKKNGQKYKLVAIPEQTYQKLTNAYTRGVFDAKGAKLAISTQTTSILEINQNTRVSYDSRNCMLFVGSYNIAISRGLVHRSLSIMTKNKKNTKKIWYYKDLLDELGGKSDKVLKTVSSKPNVNKNCYNKFKYIKDNLPPEIKDFLTVKSDHVCINEKYIK
jgi:hypothetical protein